MATFEIGDVMTDKPMDDLPRVTLTKKGRAILEMGITPSEAHEIETGCTSNDLCSRDVELELINQAHKPFFTDAGDYRGPIACQLCWSTTGMSLSEVEQLVADYLAESALDDHWECYRCYKDGPFCAGHLAEFQSDSDGMRDRLSKTYEGRLHLASYEDHQRMLAFMETPEYVQAREEFVAILGRRRGAD